MQALDENGYRYYVPPHEFSESERLEKAQELTSQGLDASEWEWQESDEKPVCWNYDFGQYWLYFERGGRLQYEWPCRNEFSESEILRFVKHLSGKLWFTMEMLNTSFSCFEEMKIHKRKLPKEMAKTMAKDVIEEMEKIVAQDGNN